MKVAPSAEVNHQVDLLNRENSGGDMATYKLRFTNFATVENGGSAVVNPGDGVFKEFSPSPGAASRGAGQLDVFGQGLDTAIWHRSWKNGWSDWLSLGGELTSGPAAVSWGPGRVDVVARGMDRAIWHIAFDNGSWGPWESLGGELSSGPAIASWGHGRLDIVACGMDSAMWHLA